MYLYAKRNDHLLGIALYERCFYFLILIMQHINSNIFMTRVIWLIHSVATLSWSNCIGSSFGCTL